MGQIVHSLTKNRKPLNIPFLKYTVNKKRY